MKFEFVGGPKDGLIRECAGVRQCAFPAMGKNGFDTIIYTLKNGKYVFQERKLAMTPKERAEFYEWWESKKA